LAVSDWSGFDKDRDPITGNLVFPSDQSQGNKTILRVAISRLLAPLISLI
jgi:hypothetical protein